MDLHSVCSVTLYKHSDGFFKVSPHCVTATVVCVCICVRVYMNVCVWAGSEAVC